MLAGAGVSAALRVLIADDHPLFRVGLGYALRGQGIDVVAEANDGADAVAACRKLRPDAAVLDVKMPVMDGLAACRELKASLPGLVTVLLTTFEEPALVNAAADAGARGFLSKEIEPALLARTLRTLVDDPSARRFPAVDLPSLSGREAEVLRLLVGGLTNKEIARSLGLSPETIKDRVEALFRKLGARNRVEAVQQAQQLGLS